MNKNRVNQWLLPAKEALVKTEIAIKGKIANAYKGQIASFGAAVIMGNLPAAVAFFTEQGGSSVERQKLIQAMYYCISGELKKPEEILEYVCENNNSDICDKFTDASIALKLAMNFFNLDKG